MISDGKGIGKDVTGHDSSLIWGISPKFGCRDRIKPRSTSVRVVSVTVEARTWHVPHYRTSQLAWSLHNYHRPPWTEWREPSPHVKETRTACCVLLTVSWEDVKLTFTDMSHAITTSVWCLSAGVSVLNPSSLRSVQGKVLPFHAIKTHTIRDFFVLFKFII